MEGENRKGGLRVRGKLLTKGAARMGQTVVIRRRIMTSVYRMQACL